MLIFKGLGRVGNKTVYFYGKRRLATFQEIGEQPSSVFCLLRVCITGRLTYIRLGVSIFKGISSIAEILLVIFETDVDSVFVIRKIPLY